MEQAPEKLGKVDFPISCSASPFESMDDCLLLSYKSPIALIYM